MLINEVKKLKPLDRLVYWIKERESIYRAKQAGKPKPWTDDAVLQSTYFTNVYREKDKVTKWYADNIRSQIKDPATLIFATIAFRWFNWPDSGEELKSCGLLENWNTGRAVRELTNLKNANQQIFTGAYNISNSGSTKPKINRVCEDYIQPVWEKRQELANNLTTGQTLAITHDILRCYPGLGGSGFMAGQIVADLKYAPFLKRASDWFEWATWGPGSKHGMNWVQGRDPEATQSYKDWRYELLELQCEVNQRIGRYNLEALHAQDLQNCLCEYSKYMAVLTGKGKAKRGYSGRS